MQGYAGAITLVGEELHHPYDKPPLSKEMLLTGDGSEPVVLLTTDELEALNVELHLGLRANRLDPANRIVETTDGRQWSYTELVIATGVHPRRLPGTPDLGGIQTIRTADDAVALRGALERKARVVVIGAGFIGAEFASAARSCGCDVAMIEAQDVPMSHILGEEVGALLARLHPANGVELHTGVQFDHFEGTEQVTGVALSDGRVLAADLVVVGIGAEPATGWLEGSGLPIDNGIDCDEQLRVIGFPGIYAAGDVARWPHPLYGFPVRIEHWTNANEHGAMVAAAIMAEPAPRTQVPYVWSDQYGHRIQMVGRPSVGDLASLHGQLDDHLVAVYADSESRVVGAVVVDDPRMLMKFRKAIANRSTMTDLEIVARPVSASS
jgi:NADPH-dependent 2,4-dienoyl-CoA reductase/sulfur reductase-like enzyme